MFCGTKNVAHICVMGTVATSTNDATMIDATTAVATARHENSDELRARLGLSPRTMQRRWKASFAESYDAKRFPTQYQISVMESLASGGSVKVRSTPAKVNTGKVESLPEVNEPPVMLSTEHNTPVQAQKSIRPWALWVCLAFSLACSIPNMFEIALAMKGSWVKALLLTSAFTVSPFLLLGSGIGKIAHYAAYVVISLEVMCNASAIYGGLTGLETSVFVKPTTFLHMITSMVNKPYEPTALVISLIMAICIAVLAVVPVHFLSKPNK